MTTKRRVILNCDLGEGLDNDHLIMPYIQACNLACGGHAGNEATMTNVVTLAVKHNVAVGAHPSYPDRKNFGRKTMDISKDALVDAIQYQLLALEKILNTSNTQLHHIKPHGALYNDIAHNDILGAAFLRAVENYKETVVLFLPFGSHIIEQARGQGFNVCPEAFADRSYNINYSLVSRSLPNAVLSDPDSVLTHMNAMVNKNELITITGERLPIHADTYCVHSDTESALKILALLHNEFCN